MFNRFGRLTLGLMAVVCSLAVVNSTIARLSAQTSGVGTSPSLTPEKVDLPKAGNDGWISLFNGKDLKGWYGDPKIWRVENGYISGKIDKVGNNTFLIFNHPFDNFELVAKCMLIKGKGFTNSGIQYRSKVLDEKKWIVGGYQADMGANYWGTLYEERGRAGLGKKLSGAKDPKEGEWAEFKIIANGNHLEHFLNGEKAMDLVDTDAAKGAKEGIIALQYHQPGGFEVRFKDIKIKLLDKK